MEENPYVTAWAEYRRIRLRMFRLALLFFPLTFGSAFIAQTLFHAFWPAFPVLFGWMLAYIECWQRLWDWRCPRCQERFFDGNHGTYYWNSFARRCLHCRLPLWTVEDEQPVNRLLVPTGREARD
jgi:hypothetical protein